MENDFNKVELVSNGIDTIQVFSEDMLLGLRQAAQLAIKIGFGFKDNQVVGLFAECIIFSYVNNREECHVIKVDQDFEAYVRKIQYG